MALTWVSLLAGCFIVWAVFFLPAYWKREADKESTRSVVFWYFGVSLGTFGLFMLLGIYEQYG